MRTTQPTHRSVPPANASPTVFDAEGLSVSLGGKPVLRELSFSIIGGSWVGLLGPNGSGKTTLLRTLGGLLPFSGQLDLQSKSLDSWRSRERARQIAFVRQQPSLDFDFTVEEVVALGLSPHLRWLDRPSADQRDRVRQAMADADLLPMADRIVSMLSGGEQQRVQLAQALAQDVGILLLDEPTAHLDVHHQYDLMARLSLLVQAGRTVVAAFHDLEFAARFSDHLLILDRGRLAADGNPGEVLTTELIRDVFRMEADVEASIDGPHVRYLAPV